MNMSLQRNYSPNFLRAASLDRPFLSSAYGGKVYQVTPREYNELQDRWVGFTPSEMLQETFLPSEYEFIQDHTEEYDGLRLSGATEWPPIDFKSESGEPQGVAAEIFSRFAAKHDIALVQGQENAQQGISAVVQGDADVIPAVVPNSQLKQKLDFTQPYLSLPLVLATRRSEIFIKDLNAIDDKRLSYVDRGELSSLLARKYPHLEFVQVDSAQEGLQRVKNEQDFAFIGTIPGISYAIQNQDHLDIKISGTLEEELPVAAGVKQGNDLLLGIVQKGLLSTPLSKRQEIVDSWISIRFEEEVDYTLVWWVLSGAFLAVAISFLWLRKVQLYNAKISEAYQLLEKKSQELEQLSITDKLTGLFNRSKIEDELEREALRFRRHGKP